MRRTWFVRPWTGVRSYVEFDVHSWPACRVPDAVSRRQLIEHPLAQRVDAICGDDVPGNAAPVVGSMIGWMVPFVIRVCEKSPAFSSAVGMLARVMVVGRASSVYSCEMKK